ncbi:MAG TPA: T3SS effector HopA1 family protein [Thermoanaerobaculia bacterium]|nr:T3SS effector HopA1 family protein [Thermoanaerobaculia bacterium]
MPETPVEEIRAALRSVIIRSPGELEIDGEVQRVPDPLALFQMNAAAFASSPMLALLQMQVYSRLYSRATGTATMGADLTPELSAANRGVERWEDGWTVIAGVPGGMLTATRDHVTANLLPHQYVTPEGGTVPPGTRLMVLMTKEAPRWQEGFYYALSEVPIDIRYESRQMRVYFHIRESGAPALVSAITEIVNAFGVPFRFKILNHSGTFDRADAAVLFAPKRYASIVGRLLPRIAERVQAHLGDATPLMALRVAPGIAIAEDPAAAGDSFGTHRTRLLAMAIWNAYTRGAQSVEARMAALEELFRANGLRLDRPYLNAGSADLYESAVMEA